MGIYSTKTAWQRALNPFVAFCVRQKVHPDWFTYGALALSALAGAAFFLAATNRAWLLAVPLCAALRLIFNLLDGLIARAQNSADAWGEAKNEFGDRAADALIFSALGLSGYVDARIGLLALVLILLVSYLGILGKAIGGARVFGGVFGKGDRMISLSLFTAYPFFTGDLSSYNFYLGVAALAATLTIIQRLRVIYGHAKSAR